MKTPLMSLLVSH
ncbi:UNVERIFIED_CONTAM: hypothetical protein NCL1_61315 [Trichonephila clavipes]